MIALKYNTAGQEIPLGQALDSTDGDTEESGLTIANTDIKLWKTGATTLASKNSGGATYISNGVYYLVLDATDTNTYGPMVIFVHVAGALAMKVECWVMNVDAYNALMAATGTGVIEADLREMGGVVQSATDLKDFADAGYDPAVNKVEGVKLVDTTTTNTDVRGTDSAALASVATEGRLAELDGGNLPSDVDAILADVTGLNGDAMRGTNSAALASVATEGRLAELDAANLPADIDTIAGDVVNLDGAAMRGTDSAATAANLGAPADIDGGGATIADNLKKIADDNGGVDFDAATDSLEAIRNRGDAEWTTGAGGTPPTTLQSTTIAVYTSQTSFTLTAGSADDNAYNGAMIIITDQSTGTQKAVGLISNYTGATLTVTLVADPLAAFTFANGDTVDIIAITKAVPAALPDGAGGLPISDAGGLDLDAKVGALAFTVANQVDANAKAISDDEVAADNLELQYDATGLTGDTFPSNQAQLNNIANTGAAVNKASDSDTLTTGTQTAGTYVDTATLNETYHQISDDTGEIEIYYEFDVGGDGVPTSATWIGRLNEGAPVGSTIVVYAYNWGDTSWDQIGTIDGQLSAIDLTENFTLFTSHVGTGANLGKVRIRFYDNSLSSGDTELYTDQLFVSYAVVSRTVGYADGRIWIDTVNGTAGTIAHVNGVADKPVDSLADALTLNAGLNLNRFQVAQGSTLTFVATMDDYDFNGIDYTIAFGGQQVDNSVITGANLSGVAVGNGGSLLLLSCQFQGATTLPEVAAIDCALAATITLGEIGNYVFERCFSVIAGTTAPIVDVGAALGNQNINFRHYSGGLEIENLGQAGTDNVSLEGWGQLILNANCAGGTIAIRGHFTVTDNASGAVTLSDDARFEIDQTAESVRAEMDSNSTQLAAIKLQTDDQPAGVKKNIALDDFQFLMIDSTDHFTPKTGLTVTATINLDGGAFGACTNSVTEVSSGTYKISFTQAEMNAKVIGLIFTASGADQRTITILTSE